MEKEMDSQQSDVTIDEMADVTDTKNTISSSSNEQNTGTTGTDESDIVNTDFTSELNVTQEDIINQNNSNENEGTKDNYNPSYTVNSKTVTHSEQNSIDSDESSSHMSTQEPVNSHEDKIPNNSSSGDTEESALNEQSAEEVPSLIDTESISDPEQVKENDVKDECFHGNEAEPVEEEKKEEYLDILGNGSLKRKILKAADPKAKRPMHGDTVTIRAEGRLEDDTVVDKHESFTFILGDGDVIQAWDLAVNLMEEGQIIELQTEARFAFGQKGRKPDIPPNSNMVYIIELLKKDYPPDYDAMAAMERLEHGEKKRERGNYLFLREEYIAAINSYTKAVRILDPATCSDSAENLQLILESRLKCYNNMAACQLKTEAYDAAMSSCRMVLDVQADNVKALFRMGKACAAKGETREGLQYMRKAQKLDSDTKVINQEIMKLSKKLNAETQSEKNMYQKMLGQKPRPKEVKTNEKSGSFWKWTSVFGGVTVALLAAGVAYRQMQH